MKGETGNLEIMTYFKVFSCFATWATE